jgi:hypothetical protein
MQSGLMPEINQPQLPDASESFPKTTQSITVEGTGDVISKYLILLMPNVANAR